MIMMMIVLVLCLGRSIHGGLLRNPVPTWGYGSTSVCYKDCKDGSICLTPPSSSTPFFLKWLPCFNIARGTEAYYPLARLCHMLHLQTSQTNKCDLRNAPNSCISLGMKIQAMLNRFVRIPNWCSSANFLHKKVDIVFNYDVNPKLIRKSHCVLHSSITPGSSLPGWCFLPLWRDWWSCTSKWRPRVRYFPKSAWGMLWTKN